LRFSGGLDSKSESIWVYFLILSKQSILNAVPHGRITLPPFLEHFRKHRYSIINVVVNPDFCFSSVRAVESTNVLLQGSTPRNRERQKQRIQARIVKALTWLEETGAITQKPAGLRHAFQLTTEAANAHPAAPKGTTSNNARAVSSSWRKFCPMLLRGAISAPSRLRIVRRGEVFFMSCAWRERGDLVKIRTASIER
jgi:hypothetical protein